ncbi:Npun_F0296 family exosortase-dependent surface protein [Sneathiella aquimaris]|uniref:Npun_F0296 family exosortase-dependent surface protein n=1 Tax=Sneathiella aquimaris TaxID=2599305 RepID=UPI00146E82BD|nr:hypothetical protein [Sneathiella aquimaris]
MKTLSKLFVAAAGALVLFVSPVQASTFTLDFTDPAVEGMLAATSTTGTVNEGISGSLGGLYTSPWSGANAGASYTSVQGGATATYDFGSNVQTNLEFLWGSIDNYNTLAFYLNDVLVENFDVGAVLAAPGVGLSGMTTATISIQDILFDEVVFGSAGNAFEYANLNISVVPLPAALPLYGAGVALLGFMGWRKRRKSL